METVLLVFYLLVAIFLVAVILMQRSSGGALSGLGGDSGATSIFSARGTGNFLTRLTAVLATLFFLSAIALLSSLSFNSQSLIFTLLGVEAGFNNTGAKTLIKGINITNTDHHIPGFAHNKKPIIFNKFNIKEEK